MNMSMHLIFQRSVSILLRWEMVKMWSLQDLVRMKF